MNKGDDVLQTKLFQLDIKQWTIHSSSLELVFICWMRSGSPVCINEVHMENYFLTHLDIFWSLHQQNAAF